MGLTPIPTRRGRIYIKRWIKPKVGEPAHGFFQRLTLANHHDSAATFGRKMNIAEPNDSEGCLLAIAGYAKASAEDLESLRWWTPRFDGYFGILAGQTIRRDDWTVGHRRYCAACLAEDAWHRTWFDLSFVHSCPFHGTPVSHLKPDGRRADFTRAETTYSSSGVPLAIPAPRLDHVPDTIEAQAVGRLGLMPLHETPFLSRLPLAEIVAVSGILGRLREEGWRRTACDDKTDGVEQVAGTLTAGSVAAHTLAAGFAVIRGGRAGIKDLLRDVAGQAPATTFGSLHLFGWLKRVLTAREDAHQARIELQRPSNLGSPLFVEDRRTLFQEVTDLADEVALDLGRRPRPIGHPGTTQAGEAMTMQEVGMAVGKTEAAVLGLARDLGLLLPHKGGTGTPFLMPRSAVPDLAAALARSVTRGEAAAMLGVSYDAFSDIARACGIPKVRTRWGERDDGRKVGYQDRFERDVLVAFLDSIPSEPLGDLEGADMPAPWPKRITIPELIEATRYDVGDMFKGLFAGKIRAERTGRDRGLHDFEVWPNLSPFWHPFTKRCMSGMVTRGRRASDGMPMREASALLEVEPDEISVLAAEGHFGGDPGDTTQNRLDREAVVDFFQRFATAGVYAEALGVRPRGAFSVLHNHGITPAITATNSTLETNNRVTAYFFDRAEVREALGLDLDPESTDGPRIVWKRLSTFLGQNQSAFSVWRIRGERASVSTSSNLWPVEVAYKFDDQPPCDYLELTYRYSITARLIIEGAKFRERRDELLTVMADRVLWPEMRIEVDEGNGRLVAELTTRFVHFMSEGDLRRAPERRMSFVARYGADDVEVIEHMLHMIKGGLERTDRTFDLRTFGAWDPVRMRPWTDDEHRFRPVQPERLYRVIS